MHTSFRGLHSWNAPMSWPLDPPCLPLPASLLAPWLSSSCPSLPVLSFPTLHFPPPLFLPLPSCTLYPASFLLPWSILQLFCLDINCISCWAKSSSTRVSSSSLRTSGSVLLSRSHLQTVRATLGRTDGSAVVTNEGVEAQQQELPSAESLPVCDPLLCIF